MPSRIGPSDADRYGWPGVPTGVLAETCTPVARQIARSKAGSVGFIPAAGALGKGASLAPLVVAVAEALLGFVSDDVAIVDSWPTWPWGEALAPQGQAIYRERRLAPRIVEIAPLPCGDPQAATIALRATFGSRTAGQGIVLVNLAGYAAPGVIPPALELVAGAVLVVRPRRTPMASLARSAHVIPPGKNLGVILVD